MHRSAALVLTLLSAGSLAAQAQFFAPTRPAMATDLNPEFKLGVGDVNGDLFPDIVCANMGGTVPGVHNTLYLNDGLGGFLDVTATHLPQAAAVPAVAERAEAGSLPRGAPLPSSHPS